MQCGAELAFAKNVPWFEDFNFVEEILEPIVGRIPGVTYYDETYSIGGEIMTVFFLVVQIVGLYSNWVSEYYYMGFGQAAGALLFTLVVEVDHWFNTGLLPSSNRQERYLF